MNTAIEVGQQWWRTWRDTSVNTRIFAAMITVGVCTVLVKMATAAKEVAVAYQFGAGDALDTFLIALLLPQFAMNVVSGSLNAAFIPTYTQVREHEGQAEAQRLFSSVMVWSAGLLIAGSVVLALMAPYILRVVGSGFADEKLALATSLYYILLPCLLLSGVATTWGAILNAHERFAFPSAIPIMSSVVTVLMVVFVAGRWGIYALAIATVGGLLLETALLGWWLGRRGFTLIPRWYGTTPALNRVWRQYMPMAAGAFLMGSTSLVGQSMAAMLSPGSVSILSYGSKITMLLLGVASVAVSTAVLPYFSRMVTAQDWRGVQHTLATYARLILLITLPLTLLLIYCSEPLVRLVFQRGAFTEADTHLVAGVQSLYLLQVPLCVLGILAVRLISALHANRILMWGAMINLPLSIVLNYVFMQWLGVAGIALAESLMYLASTSFLLIMTLRLMRSIRHEHR